MAVKFSDKLTPEGKRFLKELEELKGLRVRVGFQQGEVSTEDGVDMVDIVAWNELGTSTAPARPFIRDTFDNHTDEIRKFAVQQAKAIMNGATAKDALQRVGVYLKGLMQKEIVDGSFEPNAEITIKGGWMHRNGKTFYIKGKKSDRPLIDTGRMRQSVNYVIKSDSEE
jgi:hypothetical protein